MHIDHQQTQEADGYIHEKDESPMKVANDQAACDGAQHRANQTRNGDKAHGANEFGLGKGAHEGEPAYRHHHGSAAALQDSAGNQQMNVARHTAEK